MLAKAMETGVLKALVPRGRRTARKEESSCWGVFLAACEARWARSFDLHLCFLGRVVESEWICRWG